MAVARIPLPVEVINEYLELCDGGVLVWKKSPHHRIPVGSKAGRTQKTGHLQVMLQGRSYGYHRIVYYMAFGIDSIGYEIDHINRDPLDNRPENLRLATSSDNKWNTTKRNNTNVGHRGIRKRFWGASWKWEATFRGKYIGSFSSLDAAIEAREALAREHAGEFYCPPNIVG
jgi:hypothetical protein